MTKDCFAIHTLRMCVVALSLIIAGHVYASPPLYKTFKRDQKINYTPTPDDVLRIWMVDVGQGDGLLIQLPEKYRYDPNPNDTDPARTEHIEILIDGGSDAVAEADNMLLFLQQRLPTARNIEYAVITHHDADHVRGLIRVLNSDIYHVQTIFHNGLASYRGGKHGFPTNKKPDNAVVKFSDGKLTRGMALVNPDGSLVDSFLIQDIDQLKTARKNDELHNIYASLADGIEVNGVERFDRAFVNGQFINQAENTRNRGVNLSAITFTPVWPQKTLKKYRGWGETINGNSVTFRLKYGEFEMLFTGDHNELSEAALLSFLKNNNTLNLLNCDVLKVPHHGSNHALEAFFKSPALNPVVSIASMGEKGFKSKAMGKRNWQHPATEVIKWLGGSHRVYHTYIHERRFRWPDLNTNAKLRKMVERRHILIETDGKWFRLVEVDPQESPLIIPTVKQTGRSHGTRWINASPRTGR